MSTVVAITPPEINAAAVGDFTRIAVLHFAGHLAGQRNYASGWRVIAFNSSMEQISELTRFDGAPIALPFSVLPDSLPFPSCQIRSKPNRQIRSLKPKCDKITPKPKAPKVNYALCGRLDGRAARRGSLRGRQLPKERQ
jgi:hypothetical protein